MTQHSSIPYYLDDRALPVSRAVLLAVVAELALIGAVIYWMSHTPPTPPVTHKAPMKVSLVTLPKPEKPKPEVTPPKPPPPKPVVTPRTPPLQHREVVNHIAPPKPLPMPATAQQTVVAPPVTPPPPPPVTASADETAQFEGEVRQAIQNAVVYPAAARMLGRTGRVRVGFDYRDGVVTGVHLVEGTGFGPLDSAALVAVRNAQYPQPTAKLQHKLLHMVLWVRFDEVPND